MKRELTGTVYIVERNHILLVMHRKLGKWLPPGGHVAPGELPHECAKREAFEETGLEIEFIMQDGIAVDYPHARSIPHPYMCLLEEIPAYRDQPAHQHADFIYVGEPSGGRLSPQLEEVADIQWFTIADLEALERHRVIYPEVQDTAMRLCQIINNPI